VQIFKVFHPLLNLIFSLKLLLSHLFLVKFSVSNRMKKFSPTSRIIICRSDFSRFLRMRLMPHNSSVKEWAQFSRVTHNKCAIDVDKRCAPLFASSSNEYKIELRRSDCDNGTMLLKDVRSKNKESRREFPLDIQDSSRRRMPAWSSSEGAGNYEDPKKNIEKHLRSILENVYLLGKSLWYLQVVVIVTSSLSMYDVLSCML
jgi:hypothetical protein